MPELEDRLRDELNDDAWSVPRPTDPIADIASRASRRRRGQAVGIIAFAAAGALAVSIGISSIGPDATAPAADGRTDPTSAGPTAPVIDPDAPVLLESVGFALAAGEEVTPQTQSITFDVSYATCNGDPAGWITPRVHWKPDTLTIALYEVAHGPENDGCRGGLGLASYTLDLLYPIGHQELVLDHSEPTNPPDAQRVPDGATIADYVDDLHPDRAVWKSEEAIYSLWATGTSEGCGDALGYLSLLAPNDPFWVWRQPTGETPDDPIQLPSNAVDSRYRAGPVQLWFAKDMTSAYLVLGSQVEEWPAAPACLINALDLRSG